MSSGNNNPDFNAAFSEAFCRPAIKTPPASFASVEDAEAAGWKFDPALGRWEASPEQAAHLKRLEKFAKSLTSERVDAMDRQELESALETLGKVVPTRTDTTLSDVVVVLRQQVKTAASEVEQKCRAVRKYKLSESLLLSNNNKDTTTKPNLIITECCHSCGKPAAAGKRLSRCGRCLGVSYCNAECQKLNWSSHKGFCKKNTAYQAELASNKGGDQTNVKKFNDVMAWYTSVPQLAEGVICLAWLHRKESPYIQVKGGVNARLAITEVVPRSAWSKFGKKETKLLGYEARFSQSDFDPDVHYFVVISAAHPGTSDWPVPTPRMKFPLPPDQMDAWVAQSRARGIFKHEKVMAYR
mmetsp:Transcript_20909/g.29838  ORF Transcript_20909/g.29838 Transcript_20909/m.29838 type:complete len:355 (-) Transcript_20909:1619-2683(-)